MTLVMFEMVGTHIYTQALHEPDPLFRHPIMGIAAGTRPVNVSWRYHKPDQLPATGADILIDTFVQLNAATEQRTDEKYA